ncbi:uncharacterized protein LOC132613193 [Lycium barbarum]|uniref:uncharacterized protein LOC132613193 n=1 Tax=Lycium barbarum TaxID=112863 RepID=UPI00293E8843|nr:uncharacterized protein LOC132613193 [Lycium barbarum]
MGEEATTITIDHHHPLYLQSSDVPGSTVSSELIPSIIYTKNAKKVWDEFKERFDRSNLIRIYHIWNDIVNLKQGNDTGTAYYSKMKKLWDELDVIVPLPLCCDESKHYTDHLKAQRLIQFLMGFNESYSNIRRNLLAKGNYVTVNEAYAVATQEESQKALGVVDTGHGEALTMLAGRNQGNRYRRESTQSRNFGPPCGDCDYKGHITKDCYRLVGYPANFKSKNKQGQSGDFKTYANSTTTDGHAGEPSSSQHQTGGLFTPQQYQEMLNKLDESGTEKCVSNMAVAYEWIVDSGASHHITPSKELLHALRNLSDQKGNQVQIPTEGKSHIESAGNAMILEGQKIQNVLHGIFNGKVMGIGRERDGLYILQESRHISAHAADSAVIPNKEGVLWHMRLGHPSGGEMKHIPSLKSKVESDIQDWCEQNETVERKHRRILEVARALRFQSGVPIIFWGDCVRTVVYLSNKLPILVLDGKSPYEKLFGKEPSIEHLRIFGCLCYPSQLPKGDKFDPRASKSVLVGYSETQKGYRLFDLSTKAIFISRDVTFKEYFFPFKKDFIPSIDDMFLLQHEKVAEVREPSSDGDTDNTSPIFHEEVVQAPSTYQDDIVPALDTNNIENDDSFEAGEMMNEEQSHTTQKEVEEEESIASILQQHEEVDAQMPILEEEHGRPARTVKPPIWHRDYVVTSQHNSHCAYPISDHISYSHLSIAYQTYLKCFSSTVKPRNFHEASKEKVWIEAMQKEIEALEDNNT